MHDLLHKYTFLKSNKLHDRLFDRPDGEKVQKREEDHVRELLIPMIGDQVRHRNGGPVMAVESFQAYPNDYGQVYLTCSWWSKTDNGWVINHQSFDHRLLMKHVA